MAAERKLILEHWRSPGDVMVFTALIRDIVLRYGERYAVDVNTWHPELWLGNPYLTKLNPKTRGVEVISLQNYRDAITQSEHGDPYHFLVGFCRMFTRATGIPVETTLPKPDLHLTPEEQTTPLVPGRYWVMMAGGKSDVPIKHWSFEKYQLVADELASRGIVVVQAGAAEEKHVNASLTNVVNFIGKTNLRQFLQLIYHAEGVVGPITAAMHCAAAFDKPCVVIGGGREAPWWEWYGGPYNNFGPSSPPVKVPHRFFHTIGRLDCGFGNLNKGCWKKFLVKPSPRENRICSRPEWTPRGQPIAHCMNIVTETDVVNAVMSYYEDGTLPPPLTVPVRYPLEDGQGNRVGWSDEPLRSPICVPPQPSPPAAVEPKGLDHEVIGGKITFCTLLYGDHHDLHVRCLQSLLDTVPDWRLQDVRIGMNAVCEPTRQWVEKYLLGRLPVSLFEHRENALKYPVMREMFHTMPIVTPYTIWWDDDTYAVDKSWLSRLGEAIVDGHPSGHRLYGINFRHQLRTPKEAAWFKSATWYKGRAFQTRQRGEAPNGDSIFFVSGGFFAIESATIYKANIPDPRLVHNGGDICIGEQVHQSGGRIKEFNTGKRYVFSSGSPPRGASQPPETKQLLWRTP